MELREQIENILVKTYDMAKGSKERNSHDECVVRDITLTWVKEEIKNLKLVQLDENQYQQPSNPYRDSSFQEAVAYDVGKQAMVGAGWRKVK